MGGSVWADKEYTTVFSQDYENAETFASGWTNANSGRMGITQATRNGDSKCITLAWLNVSNNNGTNGYVTNYFTNALYTSATDYKIEFDFSMATNNTTTNYPSLVLTLGSNTITFTPTDANYTNTLATPITSNINYYDKSTETTTKLGEFTSSTSLRYFTPGETVSPYWYKVTILSNETDGTSLTVTSCSDPTETATYELSDDMLYVSKMQFYTGKSYTAVAIDDLSVGVYSEEEIVPNPTAAITGVNGTDRTVTMALGTGSADGTVVKYYTDTESKSDLTTYSTPFTVSSTSTIYYYAESTSGATSDEQSINVTCEAVTLNAPVITRGSNTSVTITSNQSDKVGAPSATIYYTYGGGDPVEYTGAITVAADATITAYATATGYTNSASVSRAVALFPAAGVTQVENTPTVTSDNASSHTFSSETTTTANATYAALLLKDETQWGTNVYMQTADGKWGIRNGSWYINSTSWLMMKSMKAGDIIVANVDYKASSTVNATYSEKYSYSNRHAYIVDADGDVELGFTKPSGMDYFYGIYAWSHTVTGTQIGAFDCSTGWKGATSTPLTLKPGDSFRYQFVNYTNGANVNDQNWQLIVADPSTDDDVIEIRADWWENLHGSTVAQHQQGFSSNAGNYWTNVPSKMNGATVDMTVTFNEDKTFTMTSTTTSADESATWTYNWSSASAYSTDLTGYSSLNVYLTCAKNWLDLTSETKTAVGTTIPTSGYGSLAVAYGLDFSGVDGLTAYVATKTTTEKVKLTSVDEMPANSGIILKGTPSTTYSIPVKADAAFAGTNYLSAAVTATDIDAYEAYILQSGELHLVTAASIIPAGKAYLLASSVPAGARSLAFSFEDDETTSISERVNSDKFATAPVFNLNGQRVAQPAKGLYIKNGKKVVVK